MKKLFKEQNVSLYRISKDLHLPMAKLYQYAEGRLDIEEMPIKLVIDLAYYFHIEVNTLYNTMIRYKVKNGVNK